MTQTLKIDDQCGLTILGSLSCDTNLEYYRRMIQSDIIKKHTGLILTRVDDQYRRLDKSIYLLFEDAEGKLYSYNEYIGEPFDLYQMITNLKKMREQGLFRKEGECYYANT